MRSGNPGGQESEPSRPSDCCVVPRLVAPPSLPCCNLDSVVFAYNDWRTGEFAASSDRFLASASCAAWRMCVCVHVCRSWLQTFLFCASFVVARHHAPAFDAEARDHQSKLRGRGEMDPRGCLRGDHEGRRHRGTACGARARGGHHFPGPRVQADTVSTGALTKSWTYVTLSFASAFRHIAAGS